MRVLYDYNVFLRGPRTGVSRYFCELIAAADALGEHGISLAAPFHTNLVLADAQLGGWRCRLSPNRYSDHALRLADEALLQLRMRTGRYDIAHETHYSGRAYDRVPVRPVYTVHDLTPELFPDLFRTYGKVLAKRAMAFRSDAHFVAISHHTAEDLKRLFGVANKRISVIHHGTSRPSATGPVNRRQDLLLFVGTRDGYKNFSRVVEAFARNPDLARHVELLAFGGGPFSDAEKRALAAAGIRRAQQRSGNDEALARAYREATLFIYPSRYEGFGLPLLEAMALDCPVACARASSFPEVAGPAAAMFDPDDSDEIGAIVGALFNAPNRRNELVALGERRRAEFSWQQSAERHFAFYRDIAQC